MARFAPLPLLALLLAACGATGKSAGSPADLGPGSDWPGQSSVGLNVDPPPAGPAISAPRATWTWVDIDGAVCDDGTPTGVGVYLTDSPNLVVFLQGGGACWDYSTCFVVRTSVHGPFGAREFTAGLGQIGQGGTVLSESDGATFKGWNKVYVPYCTGDIHGGDVVKTYTAQGGRSGVVHHKGWSNIRLALGRLRATLPAPTRMVFSGSSAGGYGAAINYAQARAAWPMARSYLIDDSGPVFVDADITDYLKNQWSEAWALSGTLFRQCPECAGGDWSLAYSRLSATLPQDRLALLSSTQDMVIRSYLLLSPDNFQKALAQLLATRFDPTSNLRAFVQTGQTHTMLGDEPGHASGGIKVADWIGRMVGDDAGWGTVKP
jgi:hypothetical protein